MSEGTGPIPGSDLPDSLRPGAGPAKLRFSPARQDNRCRAKDYSTSTVAEETILRTTAVDGVARLASGGSKEAVEALFDFLDVPSLSVKRAAVEHLMGVKQGESLRGRIEERLCPEYRFLRDVRPIDVRKVTQITDPEKDLTDQGRRSSKPIAPDLMDRALHRLGCGASSWF